MAASLALGDLWVKHKKASDFRLFLLAMAFPPWKGLGVVGAYMQQGDRTSARTVFRTILDATKPGQDCETFRPIAVKLADPADPLDVALRRACP